MIIKRTEGRINADFGMNDYYKYYKSYSKNPVTKDKFHKIVGDFNKKITNLIINEGIEYKPIKIQFTFCVRKSLRRVYIKDNKLVNTTPIDWKSTKDLWENDEDARQNKTILRHLNNHTSKYIFQIKATKFGNRYSNKKLYRFKPCRSFQRDLAKRILDTTKDNFNAYLLY